MTRSLLLEKYLIILCVADWRIVRMRLCISAADADGCGEESFYDSAHLAAAAQKGKRVATPLQNRHGKCCAFFAEKAAVLPKALPLRKQKGSKSLGAGGQMRKRICVCIRSGIARRRGGKSYERFSAPTGLASQTESKRPSFSSTPAGRSSFSFAERKRRGGCKKAFPARSAEKEVAVYRMWGAKVPAHGMGKYSRRF